MSLLADLMSNLLDRRYLPLRSRDRDERPIEDLCRELLTSRGEVSGIALVRNILDGYSRLDDDAKQAFFTFLIAEMDVDPAAMRAALDAYEADPSPRHYKALMQVSEPRRQEVARRINQLPGATARLVEMRADLMRFVGDTPDLARLDQDFRHLFASWFNRGFLVLLPISWETAAHVLEKIIAYEAVHAIDSWDDLRRRLQPPDRRCFGFFHPSMPDEPLIFVEVALTRGTPNSIQDLLSADRRILDPAETDTATFYSISTCQEGLSGISFGNSLIKQVVEDVSRELPNIRTFVTLSPIPGLIAWLREAGLAEQAETPERLRMLAAYYLCEAKDAQGRPRDPVARFHLTNGAMVADVHTGADLSAKGRAASGGAMVNYLYDPARIARNHEAFVGSGRVASSNSVQALVRSASPIEA